MQRNKIVIETLILSEILPKENAVMSQAEAS